MIKGGKGGSKTAHSGLEFEKRVDLRKVFEKLNGYEVKDNDLYFNGDLVAHFYKKHGLYSGLLENNNINWEKILSKKLLPDETIHILKSNKLFIIEMKFQNVEGSVDEKLQTCDFKKKQYSKLVEKMDIEIEYVYILSDWFKNNKYKDTRDYIESVGCHFFFRKLSLNFLGLPEPIS